MPNFCVLLSDFQAVSLEEIKNPHLVFM